MRRLTLILMFLAACWIITPAPAGTITVLGTSATAATMSCTKQAPLFSQCSESVAAGSASAIADVLAGHLGALVGVSQQGFVGATASMNVGLALQDMTEDDFLEIDMSLHGSFTNAPGNGARVDMYVDNGDSLYTVSIGCNLYNIQNYGVPCYPGGGTVQTIIPLVNLDNLYLTWLLQPAVGTPPAYSDFLNSADFTITVPNGTILVNNPGGALFQAPGPTGVPEPNTSLLVGFGLILALLLGKGTATGRRWWSAPLNSSTHPHPLRLPRRKVFQPSP
jgi:hypothetical protein